MIAQPPSSGWGEHESDKLDKQTRALRRQSRAEQRSGVNGNADRHTGSLRAKPVTDEQWERREAAARYFKTGKLDPILNAPRDTEPHPNHRTEAQRSRGATPPSPRPRSVASPKPFPNDKWRAQMVVKGVRHNKRVRHL